MRSPDPLSVVLRGLAAGVVLCAFAAFTLESVMAADPVEVPHPALPKGAGTLDADAPTTFAATPSGLQYRVLRKGAGASPKATNTVKVNYHGWLDDGKVFDSSYKRGEPIDFGLNQVIPGWTEGMQLVGEGGRGLVEEVCVVEAEEQRPVAGTFLQRPTDLHEVARVAGRSIRQQRGERRERDVGQCPRARDRDGDEPGLLGVAQRGMEQV
jgi:hypothetical protein